MLFREAAGIFVGEGVLWVGLMMGWGIFRVKELLLVQGVVILLMGVTVYFFRDPERKIPEGKGVVVSPADGRVVDVREVSDLPFFGGPAKVVTIYLALWNVHVNRVPVSGEVVFLERRPGRFGPAFRRQASERNEQTLVGIQGEGGRVFVKQVAGMLARRIVCRLGLEDRVRRGERFGMIKFGSRVEVFLPVSADIRLSVGSRVRGGESVVGVLTDAV